MRLELQDRIMMKSRRLRTAVLWALLSPVVSAEEPAPPSHPEDALPTVPIPSFEDPVPDPQWVDLFNGRDLSGWIDVNTSPDTWYVNEEGLLVCR